MKIQGCIMRSEELAITVIVVVVVEGDSAFRSWITDACTSQERVKGNALRSHQCT